MDRLLFARQTRLTGIVVALFLSVTLLLEACGQTTPTASVSTPTATAVVETPTALATSTPVATATSVSLPTNTSAPTATRAPVSASIATFTPTSAAIVTPSPATSPATTAVAGVSTPGQILNFSAENAYNHVKVLAGEIGIRAAGSENQKKAGEYITKQFEASGLKTAYQESSFGLARDNNSMLTVEGNPTALKLRLIAINDKSTPGPIEAELAYVQDLPTDVAALKGKIMLVSLDTGKINDIVSKVFSAPESNRPVAILIIPNQADSLYPPNLSKAPMPLAFISDQKAGQELATQVAKGTTKAKLDLRWENTSIPIRNVIGTRPGESGDKAPVIIIGGHYDSVPEGPGANDNASGTAITIELARVLAKAYPKVEFRFIAFDGEELGLIGSRDYVNKLSSAEKTRILAMINIDMVSVGQNMSVVGTNNLAGIAKGVALDLGYRDVEVRGTNNAGGGSDHASFAAAKIPILFFDRQSDPNYHRPGDTPDKFNAEPLNLVGQITMGTLQRFLTTIE
jgi:hypothetical protein